MNTGTRHGTARAIIVGESMHIFLKETGEAGAAGTPEARKIRKSLF